MFKQVLALLSVQFNSSSVRQLASVLSQEEWNSRQLTKETMISMGLKGSPKLSKVLVGMGVPQRSVELALSGSKQAVEKTEVIYFIPPEESQEYHDSGMWYVWNQTSEHFNSCQHENSSHDKRNGDFEDFSNFRLFFWVAGGNDLKARAKIRLMSPDPTQLGPDGFYLYVERPYGQSSLLMDDFNTLVQFGYDIEAGATFECPFKGILMPPLWERPNGIGNDFESKYKGMWKGTPLYNCAPEGYQDTLTRGEGPYTCFISVYESIVSRAYKNRPKEGGVYLQPIKSVEWNAQKGLKFADISDKTVNKTRDRKCWRDYSLEIKALVKAGYKPESHVHYTNIGRDHIIAGGIRWTLGERRVKTRAIDRHLDILITVDHGVQIKVRTYNQDGFWKAQPINPLLLTEDGYEVDFSYYDPDTEKRLNEIGWAEAEPLPTVNDYWDYDYLYEGDD